MALVRLETTSWKIINLSRVQIHKDKFACGHTCKLMALLPGLRPAAGHLYRTRHTDGRKSQTRPGGWRVHFNILTQAAGWEPAEQTFGRLEGLAKRGLKGGL